MRSPAKTNDYDETGRANVAENSSGKKTSSIGNCSLTKLRSLVFYITSASAAKELRSVFDDLKAQRNLVYTPEEEAQHFSRFKKELQTKSEFMSSDKMIELYDETRPAIMQSLVDEINSKQDTWTASTAQGRFYGASIGDVKILCGTFMNGTEQLKEKIYPPEDLLDLPDSFDARDGFKECKGVIGHVRDQSACGSCWAFGTVEAVNDRFCIKSGGQFTEMLSAGEMTACCNLFHGCLTFGCYGGNPITAWTFLKTKGVVTGSDFVPKKYMNWCNGCWPYDFEECAHHGKEPDYPDCPSHPYSTPTCSSRCHNKKYETPFDEDRYYTEDFLPHWFLHTDSIEKEIMTNGPVSAAFLVYEDFTSYKSGVYKHTTGALLGGHGVEIIGWGTENGTPYWLVKNSWNDEWGDGGFFKIAQGDCGINALILGGTPKV
ncbi:hypothetical protein FOZ63_012333 [Perkinsus olseni]|uniref:Peptidase C1A papain C-terminal domain-containing protein n=1 Tax=Perkinsus olseni TaxID=32597 RepID=A0A7J6U719_PEROL|nr:hypothetical protein FOZ63_012333 [Perkinsus olseni]